MGSVAPSQKRHEGRSNLNFSEAPSADDELPTGSRHPEGFGTDGSELGLPESF